MKYTCPRGCFSETPFTCDHMKDKQGDDMVLVLADKEIIPEESKTLGERMDEKRRRLKLYDEARVDCDQRWREREVIERMERFLEGKRMLRSVDHYGGIAPRMMWVGPGFDQRLVRVEGCK